MKFLRIISLFLFLGLSSCSITSKTYYIVEWANMPSQFNYPRASYLKIEPDELATYKEFEKHKMCGPITGPFIVDRKGNVISAPKGYTIRNGNALKD